ncbi:MARTX multifunctional-autoprocessing repeats-in-toxin holotoxin RtxA [Yersinia mollaretii]|uniref:MARTX multifunctional-autoprocessing repeats-in-toxin holotoxin RtxA n=1 Tax=Yersinia mollaretii TaxID=33060 RepID=UPI0011A830E0|nr:MARTX multifunctional-autoprocessing repeats-in-toxin holotoxin RtxA [Yersinia mollaretii]
MIIIPTSTSEYAYTGKHDGDDTSENIDAIGLGGNVYARGGDDNIKVGSFAAVVITGSGNDRVQGGAAYLGVLDTTGDLTVNGGAGVMNVTKQEYGDINGTVVAVGNFISHSGDSGSINMTCVGGYNQITRNSNNQYYEDLKLEDIELGPARFKFLDSGDTTHEVTPTREGNDYIYNAKKTINGLEYLFHARVELYFDTKTGCIKSISKISEKIYDIAAKKYRRSEDLSLQLVDVNYKLTVPQIMTGYTGEIPSERYSATINVNRKIEKLENGTKSDITSPFNKRSNIDFTGGGVANNIQSNVECGDVTFNGGGAVNIISHIAAEGNTSFKGGGIANIIVKGGDKGHLTFDGVGLGNVLVHKSKIGNMHVNAGGVVNVMVRMGNGDYNVKLIALGNISVHQGDGNSQVLMWGGLNTHTQIGSGRAFWVAAGGLNIMTRKGQGSLYAVVGGGGNVVTNIGNGDLTIVALGLGNIITHISDDEHHARSEVIGIAGANIVTKKGQGGMQAILAGGLNVLTQVGEGAIETIMLGGGNILTKIGEGSAIGILFGLGNIFTHVGNGSTLGVMVGAGNIYTKVGNGESIAVMLGAGNIITQIGDGDSYALMAALGNVLTKVGDGDVLALMIAKGNILTQIGNGQTIALLLAKGGNILTKVGNGMTLAAMVSIANIITHIGDGETFALMIGKANILTKVGSGLTAAAMIGNANIYSQINIHKNETIGVGIFIGQLNVMTKVGDGTALAIMVGKANIMTHIGGGITGGLTFAKGNVITKVGNGFMGILAKAEMNIITHVGTGVTAVALHGKGNILTKVGDDTTIGLLISETGNIMTHIGHGLTISIAKGKGNIITKVGNGVGVNAVWGKVNIITHIGNGERVNFIKGDANIITKVGHGQEITVAKGDANIISIIGDSDNYTAAWGKNNIITSVGDGRNVVLAKANNNIVTKVGDGDAYHALWADNNIVTKVGNGNEITLVKGKVNVTTDIGDGLNVTAAYGDANINTKVGNGISVNVVWGKYNINTKVGDGVNIAVMKGKANANINIGDGLSIIALYGCNNVSVKVGGGDYYSLAVASSNTKSNKLSALFDGIKQNILGRVGSQAISYLVNGNEGYTSGFRKGHGEIKSTEIKNLNGFKLNETPLEGKYSAENGEHDFSAISETKTDIASPDLSAFETIAGSVLGGDIEKGTQHPNTGDYLTITNSVSNDRKRAEAEGRSIKQQKEEYTQSSSLIQAQLDETDQSALVATGGDYRQQMELQAEELTGEYQNITQDIDTISDALGAGSTTGELYRQQFAGGLLQDINEELAESKKTASDNIDKSQSKVNEYKTRVKRAVAQSESALVQSEQDKNNAEVAKTTAELEAAKRDIEAQKQHTKAEVANTKALRDVATAKNRGDSALREANSEVASASQEAKSVQKSEGDTPKNRQNAEGSGLNRDQKAYQTDVKEVSEASISPDENVIPDKPPLAEADGRISHKISDGLAVEQLNTSQSKINSVQLLDLPTGKSNEYLAIPDSSFHLSKHSTVMNFLRHHGMGKYAHDKNDKNLSFGFTQLTAVLLKVMNKGPKLSRRYIYDGDVKKANGIRYGICFGLSAKYMMAERNYGPGGGKAYFAWLEDLIEGGMAKPQKAINGNINEMQKSILADYYRNSLTEELVSIIRLQESQSFYTHSVSFTSIHDFERENSSEKTNTNKYLSKLTSFFEKNHIQAKSDFKHKILNGVGETASSAEINHKVIDYLNLQNIEANKAYGGELAKNGLTSLDIDNALFANKGGYESTMELLRNTKENTFVSIMSTDHAMAISIHKNGDGYIWSFNEPNYGGVSFHDFDAFKTFMDGFTKNRNSYLKASRTGQSFSWEYNIFTSNKLSEKVTGVWGLSRQNESAFILNNIKDTGAKFKVDKKTKGRVIDFSVHKDIDGFSSIDSVTIELFDKGKNSIHSIQVPGSDIISVTNKLAPHISELNKLKGNRQLLMVVDENNIRFVNNNPQQPAEDVLIIKSPQLKTLGSDEYNPLKVKKWDLPLLKSDPIENSSSRYHSQVIIQLEDNSIVAEAAANLAAKHAGSILVRLDADGRYRVISGEPKSLQGNIRWQLVGHGRDSVNGQGNQTLANASSTELAERMKRFQANLDNDYRIKSTPTYIGLVGCTLIDKNKQQGFAKQFITELDKQGIRADVAARSARVHINEQGHKISLETDKLRHKTNSVKMVFRLNKDGQIDTIAEKVRNNVHISEIDIQRIGLSENSPSATGAIGRITEEFTPPERKTRVDAIPSSVDNNQAISYSGNINIQIGDDEFTSINWGTSNLAIKVGSGGFKTLVFGDNNVMLHIGDGISKHSVNIGGYQAFEGVQVFMGTRNISFNYGHSNDLIFMTEKTVISPPLINPFDGAARISMTLDNIANEGYDENWLQVQEQQWTLSGAKQYLNDLSALDGTSSVDYRTLVNLDTQLLRSGRGLKSDIEGTLNKKYNQWLTKSSATENSNQAKSTKVDKLRKLNDTMVFNLAIGGQGADIIVTNSNWNFTFGDNIQSIMDINLGSLFAISTQQVTQSGRVKTTMTYSANDMPRQIKNQLLGRLSLVHGDTTLGEIFGIDYGASGNIISRTGDSVDGEKILKEMLDVVAEFGGEKLKALSDPQKLLSGLKANLNMGNDAITSFAQTHGLQEKAPVETAGVPADYSTQTATSKATTENRDHTFGFNSLNLPNLFATLFNKDKQSDLENKVNHLKENMTKDLLNMEEKTFDLLNNSGFLRGDGDLNWSLGNYNFTLGGHGNDLGAYLGDNNNFWGGQGDDTFYGMGISNVFTGGQGNDSGVLMGRENTLFGGIGDDTAILAGRINHASLGEGNDKAFVFGETGMVEMGAGNDYAIIAGNYNETDAGQDQDYVVTMGNNNVTGLGEGNDHGIVFGNENIVSGNQGSDTIKLMGYRCVINGNEGDDHLIADAIAKLSQFDGNEGNDILILGGYLNNFSGGEGVDRFVVSSSVIECRVTDISAEDHILFNNVSWQDLWLQRNDYDLTILVRRPVSDDSAQGDFERVGSITFDNYFNGKRAAIVISDNGLNDDADASYIALNSSAVDDLIQIMNYFPVPNGEFSFTEPMDAPLQQQIAGLWERTSQYAA